MSKNASNNEINNFYVINVFLSRGDGTLTIFRVKECLRGETHGWRRFSNRSAFIAHAKDDDDDATGTNLNAKFQECIKYPAPALVVS